MEQVLSGVKALEGLASLLQNVDLAKLEADAAEVGKDAAAVLSDLDAASAAISLLIADLKAQLPAKPTI